MDSRNGTEEERREDTQRFKIRKGCETGPRKSLSEFLCMTPAVQNLTFPVRSGELSYRICGFGTISVVGFAFCPGWMSLLIIVAKRV